MDFPVPIEVARNPDNWVLRAEEFRVAAEVLAEQQELASRRIHESADQVIDGALAGEFDKAKLNLSSRLMMGYAIELLLKALIVQGNPGALRQNEKHYFQMHDLVGLAQKASFDMPDKRTEDFLVGLSDTLYWGKYPSTHDGHAIVKVNGDCCVVDRRFHPHSTYSLMGLMVDLFLPFFNSIRDMYYQRRDAVPPQHSAEAKNPDT